MFVSRKQMEEAESGLRRAEIRLNVHRETLGEQTARVAEQIEAVFEVQTEALSQRRQWLLGQLALVRQHKMDSINRKQEAIECSLANIQKFLSDPTKYSNNHIKESFESIHSLMSEDTRPFIAFRSDPALLREIISQYGVILKQYGGHFADPTRPSISLPSVVEEEDDEDNLTFSKKDEGTKNNESSVLHVNTFPANSSIVRAWLMTTNDSNNGIDMEFGTPKSDCDSFIKVESVDNQEMKEEKDGSKTDFIIDDRKNWLSKEKSIHQSDFTDIIKPFISIRNQNNSLWLSGSTSMDDDKDIDHCDLVQKACVVGNCKKFSDCNQKENCCNRLIDPDRPSWNKWLLENNVFKFELINPQISSMKNTFSNEFIKILKSDNKKWLLEKRDHLKTGLKRPNENEFKKDNDIDEYNLCSKLAKTNHKSIFNEPLEKWISLGRDLEWKDNKSGMIESINACVEKMTLEDWDGLIHNDDEGSKKWFMERKQ